MLRWGNLSRRWTEEGSWISRVRKTSAGSNVRELMTGTKIVGRERVVRNWNTAIVTHPFISRIISIIRGKILCQVLWSCRKLFPQDVEPGGGLNG